MRNHKVELKFGKVEYLETIRPRIIHKFAADPETIMKRGKPVDQELKATSLFICPHTRLERFGTAGVMLPSMTWTHIGKLVASDTDRIYTGSVVKDFLWGPVAVFLAYNHLPWVARIVDESIKIIESRVNHKVVVNKKGLRLGFGSKGVPREFQEEPIGKLAFGLEKFSPNTKRAAAVLRDFSEMCNDFSQKDRMEAVGRVVDANRRLKAAKDEGLRNEIALELAEAKEEKGRLLPDEASFARRFGLKSRLSSYQFFLTQFNYTVSGSMVDRILSCRYENPRIAEIYPYKSLVLWFEIDPTSLRHGNRDSQHSIYSLTKIDGVRGVFPRTLEFGGPRYIGVDDDGKEIVRPEKGV